MRRRIEWDVPALTVGVLSAAAALGVSQVGQDWWQRRAARVASLAQAIQSTHDKGRFETVAVLSLALAFALTSAVARHRPLLWGLLPLGVFVTAGAFVDARINREPNWADDLANAPVLALFWLLSSGLVAAVRAGIDHLRAPRGWPPPDDPGPADQTGTWPPPPAP